MSDPLVQSRAAALRAALRDFNPNYETMSDGDVIKYAAEDPNLDIENRKTLQKEFGDSATGAFFRGLGRGFGGDLLLGGFDALAGTDSQSILNDPVLADNTGASIAGNITGSIAGLAIPGGALVKGGKLAKAGLGAIGAFNAASQGYGQQKNEIATGNRAEVDPTSIALQAAVGGAGGAALPSVLGKQAAIKALPGGLTKGSNLAKYVGWGAGAAGLEGAGEGFASTLSNDGLHPSAQETAPEALQGAIVGGTLGTFLGAGFDGMDRVLSRGPSVNGPGAIVPQLAPKANPEVGRGNNPPIPNRAGPSPAPTLQGIPYDPQRLAQTSTKLAQDFIQTLGYEEGLVGGLANASMAPIKRSYDTAIKQLAEGKTGEGIIDRATGKVMPTVYMRESKKLLVMDPDDGAVREVPFEVISGGNFDRTFTNKGVVFGYPAQHQKVPKGAAQPVTINNRAGLPISFSPDKTEVGIVWLDNIAQNGKINSVEMVPISGLAQNGMAFEDVLQKVLEVKALEKEAAKTGQAPPKSISEIDPIPKDILDLWEVVPGEGNQLLNEFRARKTGVRQ